MFYTHSPVSPWPNIMPFILPSRINYLRVKFITWPAIYHTCHGSIILLVLGKCHVAYNSRELATGICILKTCRICAIRLVSNIILLFVTASETCFDIHTLWSRRTTINHNTILHASRQDLDLTKDGQYIALVGEVNVVCWELSYRWFTVL